MRAFPISLLIFAFSLSAAAQTPAQAPAPDSSTPAQSTPLAAAPPRVARPPAPPIVPPSCRRTRRPVTFTCGAAKKGATALTQSTLFTPTSAGWDLKTVPTVANGICSAAATDPFFFSIPVPPGNYRVTLALGGNAASTITVRAEARRLYVQTLPIAAVRPSLASSTSTSASPSSPSRTEPRAAFA